MMATNGGVLSASSGEHRPAVPKTAPAVTNCSAASGVNAALTTSGSANNALPSSPGIARPAVPRKPNLLLSKPRPPVPKKPPVAAKPPSSPVTGHADPASTPDTLHSPLTPPTTPPGKDGEAGETVEVSDTAPGSSPAPQERAAPPTGTSTSPRAPPPPLPKVPPRGAPGVRTADPLGSTRPTQRQPPQRPAPPVPVKKPAGEVPVAPDASNSQENHVQPSRPHRRSDSVNAPSRSYHRVVVEENSSFVNVNDENGKDGSESMCVESAEKISVDNSSSHLPECALLPSSDKEDLSNNNSKTQSDEHICAEKTTAKISRPPETEAVVISEETSQSTNEDTAGDNPAFAGQSVVETLYVEKTAHTAEHNQSQAGPVTKNLSPILRPSPTPPPVRPKPRKRTSVFKQYPDQELPEELQSERLSSSLASLTGENPGGREEEQRDDNYDVLSDCTSHPPGEQVTGKTQVKSPSKDDIRASTETDFCSAQPQLSSGTNHGERTFAADEIDSKQSDRSSFRAQEKAVDVCLDSESEEKELQATPQFEDKAEDKVHESGSDGLSLLSLSLQDVGETTGMLKEIEDLLKERLCGTFDLPPQVYTDDDSSTPLRPPRPRRANKLKLDCSSIDSSSTESLTSVGLSGKKAPPKPKRKHLPGGVNRSHSDVTGMKNLIDQLNDEEDEDKLFLPPRQQSLRLPSSPIPPPLPPRNKSMDKPQLSMGSSGSWSEGKTAESPHIGVIAGADGSSSAPGSGTFTPGSSTSTPLSGTATVGRSASGRRKNIPRPTRKAPPPPPHAPRLASASKFQTSNPSTASSLSQSSSADSLDKEAGYRKIANGSSAAGNGAGSAGSKTDTLGSLETPSLASDESMDHDYHEIPEHLVRELKAARAAELVKVTTKEESPPPDLPPRVYKSQGSESSAHDKELPTKDSEETVERKTTEEKEFPSEVCSAGVDEQSAPAENNSEEKTSEENTSKEKTSEEKSPELSTSEDSTSHSSHGSQRAASFSGTGSELLLDVVGDQLRTFSSVSLNSSSSRSETGSAGQDVPFDRISSSSDSENDDDEEKKAQKREKKVYLIAEEVVKSEQVFVDVLKLLNVDFRVFVSKKTEQLGHAVVPNETLNKILDFLPQLHGFSEILLKDLTDRIANWKKHKKIADVFVKKGPFLKLYSSYIRNFEHATALLDEACKKHNSFGQAVQQFETSPRCASLALRHYMLKPIQRIPQYKLLLQDYLKHLTEDSPDYKDTITALNIVSEVADHANESMRHGDNVQKLLEIQRSLIGQFEVIQPGRMLIKKGELMKLSRKEMQPRMFFLFNDVLLYTTPSASGYRLNNILPLNGMKVVPPKLEEFKNEFNIISTQRSFTVAASTPEERENWLRALWNAIDENSERYHTFKAMQLEPQTSLLDKDFVLGTKAPLWVPDARVTMCMLCLAEFSITWRRHHCRACGRIICGNCSENKAPLRYLKYMPARVCDDCFVKLEKEIDANLAGSRAKPAADETAAVTPEAVGLSISSIKARFQKIRKSARDKRKLAVARPSVLKEVRANDEGSDMSGYLWVAKNKKWKRLWFVVKGKVLYTYRASEDMAAIESMPLLGFEITRMTTYYLGAEADLLFELKHQNTQPLVFKTRNSSSGSDRGSAEDSSQPQSTVVSPHLKSSADTTTPRLIFRTDSAAATTKWLNVLREASLA